MRKLFSTILIVFLALNVLTAPAMASDRSFEYTIYFDDGSYYFIRAEIRIYN